MEICKPVGIDLGTTNSCAGVANETDSDIILHRNRMGVATTPSCVWYDSRKNEIVVGMGAFRRRGSQPEPIVSIKRRMGKMLLTPLGARSRIPENLPPELRRCLTETREQRLERYLATIVDPDPERQEAAHTPQLMHFVGSTWETDFSRPNTRFCTSSTPS